MIRRPPRSTLSSSSAASDVYKRQVDYGGVPDGYYKPNRGGGRGAGNNAHHDQVQLGKELYAQLQFSKKCRDDNDAEEESSSSSGTVSYTHLRAHETPEHLVCRLLLEKKKKR
eukprot:TRINITY_DN34143_c0_g1_i1.p1 TRINITY_DN34143_c0_g1~~TRINITY_DN34143_c0_g1_i1.p1  ORF type:complete len:113 (+),score=45.94 TRINITY_DN34143_c0_g1_i1:86-424(+)